MQRCFHTTFATTGLALLLAASAASLPLHATAQMTPNPAGGRNFPDAALRGELLIIDAGQAQINGKAVRLAPGLRIFNQDNALVFAHQLAGKKLKVNYALEVSTGMLHQVWLLSEAELKQNRPTQR